MSFPLGLTDRLTFSPGSEDAQPSINLAPFVDIVMQLICFYVFVSGSMQSYADPDVELPHIGYEQSVEKQPAEAVVNIKSDGSLVLNDTPVKLDQLGPRLTAFQSHLGPLELSAFRVTIRVDRRQRYGALEDVLQACREVGLQRILLRTTDEDMP